MTDLKNTRGAREVVEDYEPRGLGPWVRRNPWMLFRLFFVMVFALMVAMIAGNVSYGLQGDPVRLSVEQINRGVLPEGVELGDYVEIRGTPDYSTNPETGEPRVGVAARYSTAYYYFGLKETGNNLLIQKAPEPPDIRETGERVWRGKLSNVGTVIFHDTTQAGLRNAGLPRDESVPVVEIGSTPQFYREFFPVYGAVLLLWLGSIAWLAWMKNKPFAGME
jgi:hypothetical protein